MFIIKSGYTKLLVLNLCFYAFDIFTVNPRPILGNYDKI